MCMSENKPENTVLTNLCDWCGRSAEFDNQTENLVCSPCYNLLTNAGLSDEKIYMKAIYKNGLLATV